jgi:hypothetical protein
MIYGQNMGAPTLSGHNMTESGSSQSKKLLLVLAGLGILLALGLIGLGMALFFTSKPATVGATTPTATGTPTEIPPTPTVMAGIVIMPSEIPTAAPASGETSKAQGSSDTLNRQPTATRQPTLTPTAVAVVKRQPTSVTVDGRIELVIPADNIQVSPDSIAFGWKWLDNKGCEPTPDGYAFEIRIWQDTDFSPPMGAMDALVQKPNISCDPATGIRTFTIGQIRTVPGVAGQNKGRFRWDVALVQLTPYNPVITTQYRTFFY